jgi:hypothetical protein
MTQQRECAVLALSRDRSSLRAETSLNRQILVLPLHGLDGVVAEEHLLLGEAILEELVRTDLALVSEQIHLDIPESARMLFVEYSNLPGCTQLS